MTLVTGTVQDLGYDGMEGTLWARPARFRSDGQVVYAPERKPYTITGGVVSAELAPGPAVLEMQVGSHARGTFEVVIPEEDTTLADLLDTVFAWEPAQVSLFVAEREAAELAKTEAEAAAGTATAAAQQTGQDRTHVDQVRTELDEAFDESTAGNVLPPRLTETALNATYAVQMPTVAAMLASSLPVGSLVQTHGYHEAGDGGACRYVVVASKVKSYDLAGTGRAFRPSVSGTLHPKMFGTVNDGTALDNLPLQACYDYAADLGIEHIDGQGRVYTIGTVNPYEPVFNGWAHTGAIVRSGRVISNATFRTAANATRGTVPFAVEMLNDGRPTYLRNCTFDGNRAAIIAAMGEAQNGREDGGLHLVHLYNRPALETPTAERDFEPTSNVYFEECHFTDAYSYGVRPEYMDALVKFTDCTWDMHGIAVQMHATHVVVEGGSVTIDTPRTGRGPDAFHEEIEFAHDYTGSKKQTIEIRRVALTSSVANYLFKVAYPPMSNVRWRSIVVEDCHTFGLAELVSVSAGTLIYNPSPVEMRIDHLAVRRSSSESVNGPTIFVNTPGYADGKTARVDRMEVEGLAAHNGIRLGTVRVDKLVMTEPAFGSYSIILPEAGSAPSIGELQILRPRGALGATGILRSATTTVESILLDGGEFTQGGDHTIECIMGDVTVRNVKVHSPATGLRRFLYPRGATARITFRDVLFTATSATGPLVHGTVMTDGFVHLRNTRHVSGATPTTSVTALPSGRVISENTAPLVA